MTNTFKRHLLALFASLFISLPAAAGSTYSTDYSDLWITPGEDGWGINLMQQGEIIFATMFVYGPDSTARWYSASAIAPSTAGSTTFFSGGLEETRGPWFGAATFDKNAVTHIPVGTMTLTFNSQNSALLQYSVNGVNVQKTISRFTWRGFNLSGNYVGGLVAKCTNNQEILIFDLLTVTQNGAQVSMVVDFYNQSSVKSQCFFNGAMQQTGKLANIVNGNFNCNFGGTAGNAGSFSLTGIDAGVNGLHGSFLGTDQFCTMSGRFGGVRDTR